MGVEVVGAFLFDLVKLVEVVALLVLGDWSYRLLLEEEEGQKKALIG